MALHDVEIELKHIPGKKNIEADVLSRIYSGSLDEGVLRHLRENYIWDSIPVQYFELDLHLCLQVRIPQHQIMLRRLSRISGQLTDLQHWQLKESTSGHILLLLHTWAFNLNSQFKLFYLS